jgi:chromosome segregation ATPase
MLEKPDDESLEELVLRDMGINDPTMLQKIIRSWAVVHKKGNELRKRRSEIKEPYPQWIKERVKNIKLPFILIPSSQPSQPDPVSTSVEEVDELKATIERLEREKEDLQQQLHQTSYERNKFKFHFEEKIKQLKRSEEMVEEERAKKERVDECLEGVTNKIQERNDRLNQAWKEIKDWKDLWNHTLEERMEMREGFEARILDLTALLQESQTFASNERQLREEANRKLQNLSANREKLFIDLRDLKEHEGQQRQDNEALEDRARHLENQLHHMTELASHDQATVVLKTHLEQV